jgi:hypothetical protein
VDYFFFLISFAQTPPIPLQQGFSVYQNHSGSVNFSCQSECLAVLDKFSGKDVLHIKGEVQGNGTLGYGFLVGQQVIPGEFIEVSSPFVDEERLFSHASYFSQIPKDAQIVLIVQGSLQAEALTLKVKGLNAFQKVKWGWKDFLEYEPLTVYSINLRYGQKILGTSIIQWGYRISIIGIIVLAVRRKATLQNVLLLL